jgi:hypothetical protein
MTCMLTSKPRNMGIDDALTRVLSLSDRDWWNSRTFLILAMLASMVPLIVPDVPPLVDLPGHIGRYRVMLGTNAAILDQWYSFQWHLVGNLGVDLLVCSLAPLIGLEPAVKIIVIAIPPLMVLGILSIAREVHGRINPFALFALPLVYNFPFHFGFVNYALAMALALNAFALWLAMGRLNLRSVRGFVFVPISLALWVCHLAGWGSFGVLVLSAELMHARDRGSKWPVAALRATGACLPLALPFVLLVVWRSGNTGGELSGWGRYDLKLSWLAMILRDRWLTFDVASTAVLYLVLYKGVRDQRVGYSRNLIVSTAFLFLVFALLPMSIFGSAYADMRMAPFVVVLALIALKPNQSVTLRELKLLALVGVGLFGVRTVGTTISFLEYDREIRNELAAIEKIELGSRVITLIGSSCTESWSESRLQHLPGLALARRFAFSNDQWALAGAPLLTVHAPKLGRFINDPSQLVVTKPCLHDPTRYTIAQSLAELPRSEMDYLWLIQPPHFDPRLLAGAIPIWRRGESALYRVPRKRIR